MRVALLAEGVDRNENAMPTFNRSKVALLAEGVDRNWILCSSIQKQKPVALLAEGVDRNSLAAVMRSLPVRRPPRRGRG